MSKLIIFTAPSGAGKTTVVRHLLNTFPDQLAFSVSATTRPRRPHEKDGVDYYFISPQEFYERRENGEFAEWEEVYQDQYYGTLKSEMERIWHSGKHILFDIDVKGAMRLKRYFPDNSLAVFVQPPSKEVLFERLRKRSTESKKSLDKRIARATEELNYSNKFDIILINDILGEALQAAEDIVLNYISTSQNPTPKPRIS